MLLVIPEKLPVVKTLITTHQTPTMSPVMVKFPSITQPLRKMMENSWAVPVGEEARINSWIRQS
jgi:hypothetical protein